MFIPRPETESVVGYAIDWLPPRTSPAPVCVDLCAGSGAIAAALATEVEGSVVHAVELSADALPWLRRNVEPLGVTVHHVDVANALTELDGRVDVVVCNPPYIPDDAVPRDPEVVDHDPALALWGGPDGLDVVRVVERTAARLLRPGGLVVIEHADVQGETVPALLGARRRLAGRARPRGPHRPAPVHERRTLRPVSALYDCADPQQRTTGLQRAVTSVQRGELVVLPTDTVYGIGADAFDHSAVDGAAGREGPRSGHAGPGPGRLGAHRRRPGVAADQAGA